MTLMKTQAQKDAQIKRAEQTVETAHKRVDKTNAAAVKAAKVAEVAQAAQATAVANLEWVREMPVGPDKAEAPATAPAAAPPAPPAPPTTVQPSSEAFSL